MCRGGCRPQAKEMNGKAKVAILGSGNIGMDLLVKIRRSALLECTLVAGRSFNSKGMLFAQQTGVRISDQGISAILDDPACCDIIFDATSALDHVRHWPLLEAIGKRVIDMTPSRVGEMVVPAITLDNSLDRLNINMVSCGGQASIPIAHVIAETHQDVEYIEVVSSIASKSAGPATRWNIDEYVETTEAGVSRFTGCASTKAILILNPANPPVNMQTTISAKIAHADVARLRPLIDAMVRTIKMYVPGYEMIVPPVFEQNRIVVMVRVTGLGDYLPSYAGNLDIINCAAVAAAERLAAMS